MYWTDPLNNVPRVCPPIVLPHLIVQLTIRPESSEDRTGFELLEVVESRNCKIMRDSEDEDWNLTEARTFITLDVDWGRNLIEAPLRLGTPRGWNLLEAGIMLSLVSANPPEAGPGKRPRAP
ncbi:hypothetical protein J6590_076001 [Homalodisca vitripennis]|nr:hypothetical protein J6590_076001 [Homalodisca vitripennis]